MRKNIFSIFVLCLVLCFNFSACSFSQQDYENSKAADFTLQELSGKNISLSDFKGKGVILFFWATWCPGCRATLPTLNREYQNMIDSNIQLLAIDVGEPKEVVGKFKQKYSIEYPILLDSDSKVAHEYGIVGVPTFVLISKEGKIVSVSNSFPYNYKELLSK